WRETGSRLPLQKICNQRQAELLALLGVELRADDVVAPDDGRDRPAVIGFGDQIPALRRIERKGVHEIGVPPLRPERQALDQWVPTQHIERIPAHVRNLQIRIARRDPIDFAGDPAEAFDHFIFAPALGKKLHADTNAEKRPALAAHGLFERFDHAGNRVEPAPTVGEGANAGQYDAIGARHDLGIARYGDRLIQPALMGGALERFRRRVQFARTIVDDSDPHRCAPGSGKSPITPIASPAAAERGAAGGAGLEAPEAFGDAVRPAAPWRIQPSKNRRSASRRAAGTTPTFCQPPRGGLKPPTGPTPTPTSSRNRE